MSSAVSHSPLSLTSLPKDVIQYTLFNYCGLNEQAAVKGAHKFLNTVPYLLTEQTEVIAHVKWRANKEVCSKIKVLKIASRAEELLISLPNIIYYIFFTLYFWLIRDMSWSEQ